MPDVVRSAGAGVVAKLLGRMLGPVLGRRREHYGKEAQERRRSLVVAGGVLVRRSADHHDACGPPRSVRIHIWRIPKAVRVVYGRAWYIRSSFGDSCRLLVSTGEKVRRGP